MTQDAAGRAEPTWPEARYGFARTLWKASAGTGCASVSPQCERRGEARAAITGLKQELEQANHAISMAQGRMARQREIMRRLEAHGYDAAQAKTLFRR